MTQQTFNDIYSEELAEGAIINDRHTGFREDYLLLHCLLKKYKIKSCFEIGTHVGWGTQIIKNALGEDSVVYSLDLPDELSVISKQHPISEGKQMPVGYECTLPYCQLFGNSMRYDYDLNPCEGYFVDTDHTYQNVFIETRKITLARPKIIIWHDVDEPDVYDAIVDAMKNQPYELFRVVDTRIAYALHNVLKITNNVEHS